MKSKRPLRVLLSYQYAQDKVLSDIFEKQYPGWDVELFLDSGAFSAFTVGAKIDENAYFDWVEANKKSIAAAVALDVIGDAKKSIESAERMLARFGDQFPIIPAFHLGSDFVHLKTICELSKYIALGGHVAIHQTPIHSCAMGSEGIPDNTEWAQGACVWSN